jgi:hypothetical protein
VCRVVSLRVCRADVCACVGCLCCVLRLRCFDSVVLLCSRAFALRCVVS